MPARVRYLDSIGKSNLVPLIRDGSRATTGGRDMTWGYVETFLGTARNAVAEPRTSREGRALRLVVGPGATWHECKHMLGTKKMLQILHRRVFVQVCDAGGRRMPGSGVGGANVNPGRALHFC